jgi:hypothetical protein
MPLNLKCERPWACWANPPDIAKNLIAPSNPAA